MLRRLTPERKSWLQVRGFVMACNEITNAIDWAKQTVGDKVFPVSGYFTKHTGLLTDPNVPKPGPGRDYCWYAAGQLSWKSGHLVGDLQLYANGGSTNNTEPIEKKPNYTVGVDIFPDGTTV